MMLSVKRKGKIIGHNRKLKAIVVKFVTALGLGICLVAFRRDAGSEVFRFQNQFVSREKIADVQSPVQRRIPKRLKSESPVGCQYESLFELKFSNGPPAIVLDPTRFIMPVLVQGPNNQLIGLRDAIYMAVRLNRTLILPAFLKHRSDVMVDTSLRIDSNYVSKLISVVAHDQWRTICNENFEDLYQTKFNVNSSKLIYLEKDGISKLDTLQRQSNNVFPAYQKPNFNAQKISSYDLLKMYSSEGRCALYVHPFRSVGVKESTPALLAVASTFREVISGNRKAIDAFKLSNTELYSLIAHATNLPKIFSQIANEFLSQYDNERYLAVHWRYDESDWLTRCKYLSKLSAKGKQELVELCQKLLDVTPIDVANGVLSYIDELPESKQLRTIYFAAPATMAEFTNEIKHKIESDHARNLRVLNQDDLREFLLQTHAPCDFIAENYPEIASQVEMSICAKSAIFLRSPMSSWSKIIQEKRIIAGVDGLDKGILQSISKMMIG